MSDDIKAWLGFGASVITAVVIGWLMRGFVLAVAWGWFVSPVFNVRHLSIGEAIGLSLFASILVPVGQNQQPSSTPSFDDYSVGVVVAISSAMIIGAAAFLPLVMLAIAWGWHMVVTGPGQSWPWLN